MPRISDIPAAFFRFAAGVLTMAAFSLPGAAHAQQVSVQDRAQLLRPPTSTTADPYSEENGVDNGRAAESPNDPDIGEQEILKRIERYEPFNASVSTPFYYTSNVALTRNGEQGDLLVAPALGVSYNPRITQTLFGSVSVSRQEFYY